jgi:XRE family aerobic/anaerobic benzoate catabolism transcriptional regulator
MTPPLQTVDVESIEEPQIDPMLKLTAPKFLQTLGNNIRALRAKREWTRKELARHSGTSERFLAQLESGTGNASVLVLRKIASALQAPLEALLIEEGVHAAELMRTMEILRHLDDAELTKALQLLREQFTEKGTAISKERKGQRIALLGLRGAGKSTLGKRAAKSLGVPFIELDKLVEKASGVPLEMVFELYGQGGFRRYERECLEEVLSREKKFVLATSGSIVSDPATFELLLRECFTVWLKASPAEHMQRVIEQGDMRPMAKNPQAMQDLERLLAERESAYQRADMTIDTSQQTVEDSIKKLMGELPKIEEKQEDKVEFPDPLRNFKMRPRSRLRPREI